MTMKLWGTHLSPFLLRALFCGRLKGVEIPLETPPPTTSEEFRKLSPIGKIPVLQDGDFLLPESMAICEYIDEKLPGNSIWPDGIEAKARARMLCAIVDLYLHPDMFNLFLHDFAQGPGKGAGDRLRQATDAFEHYIDATGPWICGARVTLPDAHMTTVLFYFEAIGHHYGADKLISERPKLTRWWAYSKADPMMAQLLQEQDAAFWKDWQTILPFDWERRQARGKA